MRKLLFLLGWWWVTCSYAQVGPLPTTSEELQLIGKYSQVLEDPQHHRTWQSVQDAAFQSIEEDIPLLGQAYCSYWLRFQFSTDRAFDESYWLEVRNPLLDSLDVFVVQNGVELAAYHSGDHRPYNSRPLRYNSFVFPLTAQTAGTVEVYLRIRSVDQKLMPVFVGSREAFYSVKGNQDLIFGMYIGLMLVMFLYNSFIYFTTRDRSYLFYIGYILALLITQMLLEGFAYRRLFPGIPWMHDFGVVLFSALTGWAAIAFARHFLRMRSTAPRFHQGLYLFQFTYALAVLFRAIGYDLWSFRLLDISGMTSTLYGVAFSVWLVKKGYREARFYLVAWIFFIIGILVFVLKNFGILPFNSLSSSAVQIGSAAEIILLSFALGDRINRLQREREEAQEQSLALLQENERIIREQNVYLEQKVEERTLELQEANEELTVTLEHLKETQAQLVDAEKMASLGQLTAGIAHEINNPINFVSSNILPLQRDIQDLIELIEQYQELEADALNEEERLQRVQAIMQFKDEIDLDFLRTEIDELIKGIQNGAERTAEIVRGLRTFSRLDEEDFKDSDIESGLDSTLTLLNNRMRDHVVLQKEYAGLPLVNCNAGKLNQVFMNLITNAIQAIEIRKAEDPSHKGILTIRTEKLAETVVISIEDNGIGMSEAVKKRIFEPFFTTKPVGEGTGLGLSIAYKILEQHRAQTEIQSEEGKGSIFRITLPIHHHKTSN